MTQQLDLPFGGRRVEFDSAYMTWREGDTVRRVQLWPCCVDFGWPHLDVANDYRLWRVSA